MDDEQEKNVAFATPEEALVFARYFIHYKIDIDNLQYAHAQIQQRQIQEGKYNHVSKIRVTPYEGIHEKYWMKLWLITHKIHLK
jgi:hypothetical protein